MKKPIISDNERSMMPYPELEVAKLKFQREFMKTWLFRLVKNTVEFLSKTLNTKRNDKF